MTEPSLEALAAIIRKSEEDYAGLWEIPILLRTMGVRDPEYAAVSFVRKLLEEGLLGCVWGKPDPDPNAPVVGIERERVISDESFWLEDVPFERLTVWLYATPAGEQWAEDLEVAVE